MCIIYLIMQSAPFKYGQIQNLTTLGIDPTFFKFNVTHLESQRFISIIDAGQNGVPQLTVIELFNNFNIVRKSVAKVDGAIMHLKENIVALKAPMEGGKGYILQIYNMDQKLKLSDMQFPQSIVFWRWVADDILAVVTTTAVYHASIAKPEEKKVKVFEPSGYLKEGQIIGYVLSSDQKWSALFGISSLDGGQTINGHIQLYLIEESKQQLLEGHACAFGKVLLHSDTHHSNVFCFVQRKAGETKSQVYIIEISTPPEGIHKFKKTTEIVYDSSTPEDFPISLVVAERYGLLYIVTKFGFVYIYQMTSCEQIYKVRISTQSIFLVARNLTNDGILALSKNGSLFSGMIDEAGLIPHLITNCKHLQNIQQLVSTLAGRYSLPGVDNKLLVQFNNFIISGDYANAANIAFMSPGVLRNADTINKLKALPQIPGEPQPLLIYIENLLEKGKLNKLQTIELCGPVLAQGKIDLVKTWAAGNKLQICVEVGDMVVKLDKTLALKIYTECQAHAKVIAFYNEQGRLQEASNYAAKNNFQIDYTEQLKSMVDVNPEGALAFAKKLYQRQKNLYLHQIADLFLQRNRIQQFSSLLFNCMRQNKPQEANQQTKMLEVGNIVKMLESVGSFDGIFFFLGTVINSTNDKEVHHKYIEAAGKCEQLKSIQQVIKNKRDCYDPIKVKDILLSLNLTDPKLIIFLCDAHQQYDELTRYLYKNNLTKYIEAYLFKFCKNPQAMPIILGTLMDLEYDQSQIKKILKLAKSAVPMEELINEFEKRSKLSILQNWLEDRVAENTEISAVHKAMAKIKVKDLQ